MSFETIPNDPMFRNSSTSGVDKAFRNAEKALLSNAYDLPDYGAGPSAGKTVPTVAISATVLAGKTQGRALNDPTGPDYCAIYGGIPFQLSNTVYGFPVVTSTGANVGTSGKSGTGFAIEVDTNDDGIAIRLPFNGVTPFRLLLDGQFLSRTPTLLTGSGFVFINISFGSTSSAPRRLRLECQQNFQVGGFQIAPNYRLSKPTVPDFTRWAWIGDSYTAYATQADTPNSFAHDNYASFTMRLLGVTDANLLGAAGTGFARDNAPVGLRYGSRMKDLLALQQRDAAGVNGVVLQSSINDTAQSAKDIIAGVIDCVGKARAITGIFTPIFIPGVPSGAFGNTFAASPGAVAAEQAVIAALGSLNDPYTAFIPFSTQTPLPIIFGDNTSGTASLYIQADLTHPTFGATPGLSPSSNGGMEYHARAVATGIRNALAMMRRG